jgi:hypothetical protein
VLWASHRLELALGRAPTISLNHAAFASLPDKVL